MYSGKNQKRIKLTYISTHAHLNENIINKMVKNEMNGICLAKRKGTGTGYVLRDLLIVVFSGRQFLIKRTTVYPVPHAFCNVADFPH